jgi:hypothetical protein
MFDLLCIWRLMAIRYSIRSKRVVMVEWHHEHGFSLRSNHMLQSRLKPIRLCILLQKAISLIARLKHVEMVE